MWDGLSERTAAFVIQIDPVPYRHLYLFQRFVPLKCLRGGWRHRSLPSTDIAPALRSVIGHISAIHTPDDMGDRIQPFIIPA